MQSMLYVYYELRTKYHQSSLPNNFSQLVNVIIPDTANGQPITNVNNNIPYKYISVTIVTPKWNMDHGITNKIMHWNKLIIMTVHP